MIINGHRALTALAGIVLAAGAATVAVSSPASAAGRPAAAAEAAVADPTCGVRYDIRVFARYLLADVTITNQGLTAINGWTLSFVLPAGQRIVAASGARYDSPTGLIDAHDVGTNAVVGPGESVPIRFSIAHSGLPTKPVAFAVNGHDCAVAG